MKRIAILALVVVCAVMSVGPAAASDAGPATNGHGNLTIGGELRTFSFHARQRKDGSIEGTVTFHNRSNDGFLIAEVNCLRIVGNEAFMTGPIRHSTVREFEGWEGFFRVTDNGEGNDSPDQMSLYYIYPGPPQFCNSTFKPPQLPIEAGNIQVKP